MRTLIPSRHWLALALVCCFPAAGAPAVPGLDYYLPIKTADYDPAIPTPQQALGYQIGEWHVRAHERVSYMEKLDALSDRITMQEYARSPGRLPLVMLTITSPENHKKIEAIRKAHVDHVISGEPEAKDAPIIVWMGYSVHGNEPSGTNAAMLLAYHLAAARDAWTKELLQKAVVLLEPCLNPDGGERFASWTNDHRGQVPGAHRADTEHQEGWPSGRPNYYWFDLNRDYVPAVMPESQGRLRLFHEWQPSIMTDYHEMGSTAASYFFQPGIAKMVNPLTPPQNQELTRALAREHAKALDAIGSVYYTGEGYDDFYPGKGSTYPDLNGSVGILFEQSSSRGFQQDTDRGRLTFPFTIRNQLTTSFSTLRVALSQREDFKGYQTTFYREALEAARASKTKAYVFSAPGDRARMDAFRTVLTRHQITYSFLANDLKQGDRTFGKDDSIVVPVHQRQYRLLTALFEHRTEFQSAIFYDVSGWHLPSAFGMLSAELTSEPATAKRQESSLAGTVIGPEKPYAYAFAWEPRFAPRALFKLLQAKVRCWTTMRPMDTPSGLHFNPGSIIVPVGSQDVIAADALRSLMQSTAKDDQFDIHALTTGMNTGVPDIGSPSIRPVKNDGVLMVVGPGVTSTSAGDVWFEFDQVWKAPLAKVEASEISQSTLKSFSTVILTGTSMSAFKDGAKEALEKWVAQGGTLIAIGSSVASLANEKWASATIARSGGETSTKTSTAKPATTATPRYDEADERRAEREVKGAVVRSTFDPTHPLCFGYGLHQPFIESLRTSTSSLKPAANAYLNPLRYTDDFPVVSGYISKTNQSTIKGTTPVQLRESGEGRVVFFTDNPVFRGHWLGTEKLLANAIFFSPLVRTGGGDDEKEEQ